MNSRINSEALHQAPHVIRVSPDAEHADIHAKLLSYQDKVHPIQGMEDLLQNRLGHEGFSKQCFALVQEAADGTLDVLAAIYTHWSQADISQHSGDFLLGKVDDILATPARTLDTAENLATCYSISSFGRQGGKLLISQLWETVTNSADSPVISTLSPFRTFSDFIARTGRPIPQTSHEFRLAAAAHLKERINPVQLFHQGNGAYAAAFHISANSPDSADARLGLNVMVGYRYPRSRQKLEENKQGFKDGKIPASAAIRALMEASP